MAPFDRTALRLAVRQRNIERLETILDSVQENGLNSVLSKEVQEARNLLTILRRMVSVRLSLQELNQTMLSELVNQKSPNKIMVTIMKAVMVVLDVPEETLEDWSGIQAVLGTLPSKNYSFIRRMIKVNHASVKVDNARRAVHILSRYNLDLERVKSISEPLGLFYTWLMLLTEEVISIADAAPIE